MPAERHHRLRVVIKKSGLGLCTKPLWACLHATHRQTNQKCRHVSRETLTCPAGRNEKLREVATLVLFPQSVSDHLQM